jgi:hypothetical protein
MTVHSASKNIDRAVHHDHRHCQDMIRVSGKQFKLRAALTAIEAGICAGEYASAWGTASKEVNELTSSGHL